MTDDQDGPYQTNMATGRRDVTALHARISELEQECTRLRNRVAQLERALNLVRPAS
jgi:polyhydroxyalkanoate synthesis regulator phasin